MMRLLSWLRDRTGGLALPRAGHVRGRTAKRRSHVAPLQLERLEDRTVPSAPGAGVLPVNSHPFGHTYGEWSAKWWQYALSIPTPQNPNFDQTGANFAVGQTGNVWFLSGLITFSAPGQPVGGGGGIVTRDVILPAGKAILFPVLDSEFDNVAVGGPDTTFSVDQLRAFVKGNQDTAENMEADVDGQVIQNLPSYRVVSPVFSFHLPSDNIYQFLTNSNPP